ncbi:cbb3-type cytochrome c oxidase N-terminal domain-containing protein [Desertivirga xinjiangensis]|uniref:cbb3-type cytochrome c oxidase N-terminal domain-containing protein n=1 Tax=Desertivirga xinjiangensis TaxID=539206 RepID=UPI00210EE3E0|nr:cbb3-type cytochrome c oxidase N-terminal domain-containing protein [Pedobacter xinjiangensis]
MRIFLTGIFLFSGSVFAQSTEETSKVLGTGNLYWDLLIIAFVILLLLLLLVSVVLLRTFKQLSNEIINPSPIVTEVEKPLEYEEWLAMKKSKQGIWTKILGLKPLSEEKDILLEHQFDGIAELDNPTPAWFMWLFYGTIALAFGYMLTYHVFDWAPLQDEEYALEVQEAEAARKEYLSKAANLIDENTVKESSEASVITSGQAIYNSNCVACHGDRGQGVVGPNLTDEYWLHGGSVNAIFKTIKYGIPEKGMISWEKTLTPKQISEVTNFIHSLKGSNPANAKAPQGEKEGEKEG